MQSIIGEVTEHITNFSILFGIIVIYWIVRRIRIEYGRIYLGILEILVLIDFLYPIIVYDVIDVGKVIISISNQLFLLCIYQFIWKKEVERKSLFEVIKRSSICALLIIGFRDIKQEDINLAEERLKQFLTIENIKKGMSIGFFTYKAKEQCINIDVIFWKKEDYQLFMKEKTFNYGVFNEIEERGKGVAFQYKLSLKKEYTYERTQFQ